MGENIKVQEARSSIGPTPNGNGQSAHGVFTSQETLVVLSLKAFPYCCELFVMGMDLFEDLRTCAR